MHRRQVPDRNTSSPPTPETLEAWLADAIRFRREQGFVDDPVYVESLLTATDDPREQEFGTPLTDAETALMYRRGEIEVELQGIRDYGDLHARDWGGIWLTPPQDATLSRALTVNVNLVDNKAQHEAAATALAPSGVELVFHEATWSEVQLTAAHEPLRAEAFTVIPTLGTRLNAVETNIVANTLDVYVSSLTPAVEAAIKARYGGDMVRVLEGGESYDDACTRLDCGPPWKGGVKIVRGNDVAWCTLGFIVRKSVAGGYTYATWTAGHCGSGTWRQGTKTGDVIGTTSFHNGSPSYADVQVIPINAADRTNKIIDDTADCSGCIKRSFVGTAQQGFNGDEYGDTVCNNGFVTGHTCGVIRSTNVDNFEYPSGTILNNQRRATYARVKGDSGGPIFTTKGSLAAGSHVHFMTFPGDPKKYPVYTHVFEMSVLTQYYVYNGS